MSKSSKSTQRTVLMKTRRLENFAPRSAAALAVFAAVLLLLYADRGNADVPNSAARPEMPKIGIAADGSRFIFGGTGETFVPWGFNYLGRFGELVEESWADDWARLEQDFHEMHKLGANVVRVHLQFGTFMKGPDEVDAAELGRLEKL